MLCVCLWAVSLCGVWCLWAVSMWSVCQCMLCGSVYGVCVCGLYHCGMCDVGIVWCLC